MSSANFTLFLNKLHIDVQEIKTPLDLLVTDTLHWHYRFSVRGRYSETLDSAIHLIHLSRMKSFGVTSVQFVKDYLIYLNTSWLKILVMI